MTERIAILGGGMAGLTAAFELTSTPELRERYEVTIYQYGWRLGGKCASGRNPARGWRIEEHGLHLWFGAYENAFAMMRRCYAELARPASMPLATVEEAFKPGNSGVLWDNYGGEWTPVSMMFPPNDRVPGDGTPVPGFWDMAWRGLWYAWDEWRALHVDHWEPEWEQKLGQWAERGLGDLERALHSIEEAIEHAVLLLARELARLRVHQPDLPGERVHRQFLQRMLHFFREWVWTHEIEPNLDNDRLRKWFTQFDLVTTLLVGAIEEGLHEVGFEQLNDIELRDWLRRHGIREVTLSSPMVRAWYCGAFAFLDGDTSQPNMAAGVSVHGMLRQQLGYKGALLYKMQAGMGDAVVAPLYEVLRKRGVRFEFFHRVTELHTYEGEISSIEVVRQVRVKDRHAYRPLVEVRGLPCWPSEPLWDQLEDGDQMAQAGINLEVEDGPHARSRRLVQGEDFDRVVLAISIAALPAICGELLADEERPRFAEMIRKTRTCMTQGIQLWLRHEGANLGWTAGPDISSTYVEPLDTYCDMTQLIAAEDWPDSAGVKSIGYFCGVLPDREGDTLASTTARAKQTAAEFLRSHVARYWPQTSHPKGFDWEVLVAENAEGEERLDQQFWRANFALSERYVLTPVGSVSARLAAGESEWSNLVFAGDWIKNGLDLGCVEATVMSGMQAARAISGVPRAVAGEDASFLHNVAGPTRWGHPDGHN